MSGPSSICKAETGHHGGVPSPPAPPALSQLRRQRDEIVALANRHGATNVRVFGSVARGDQQVGSDLDLLVDLEPERSVFDLAALHLALEELFGCRVDIVTRLKPRMRKHIEDEAVGL